MTFRKFLKIGAHCPAILIGVVLATQPVRADAIYDPATAFEAGWSTQSNPAGVWSYGYSSTPASALTLYTGQVTGPDSGTEQFWIGPAVNCCAASPAVGFNDGPAFNDGNVAAAANQIIMVASVFQPYATDLVFTAPTSGNYSLTSSFTGDQNGINVGVSVLKNSSTLFDSTVTSIGQVVPYNTSLALSQGDTVEFAVQTGAGNQNTGLNATITLMDGGPTPVLPNPVDITNGGPADNVIVTMPYSDTGPANTVSYQNLEIQNGGSYTLGVNNTIDLNNGAGTLYVDQGGVLTGNGTIEGNVLNSGLVRIPIVALSQVSGGYIQVQPTSPGLFSGGGGSGGTTIQAGTYASFGGGGTITGTSPVVNGTFGFSSKLVVTGNYTQTSTGALRMFVGGHDQGVSYSWLDVDQSVTLGGTLEVVLEPDLFSTFGYHPQIGDKFDFVTAAGGINLSAGLQYSYFVTAADLAYLDGFDLEKYDSGISSDPDSLYQIIDPGLFSFSLIDGGTVLEATLEDPAFVEAVDSPMASVPEPPSIAVLGLGLCVLVSAAGVRNRSGRLSGR